MDYVTGTSRLSRTPAAPKPSILSTLRANAPGVKALIKQLPTANPFEFDNTVADEAKNLPDKNRTMKKRKVARESKSEDAKDKEMGVKEGSKKDIAMDAKGMRKHRSSKKRPMSFKQKSALPKKSFAVKTTAGYGGKGKYPIPDASHARNALARVSQHGSPAEKAQVRSAVSSKFPGIKESKGRSTKKRAVKKRGIGNAVAKATGWPRGINDVSLNKAGTVGTEPISKGNNKFTEVKAGSLGKFDIPMGTLNRKKRSMPQRRTNRSMSGIELLNKATRKVGR